MVLHRQQKTNIFFLFFLLTFITLCTSKIKAQNLVDTNSYYNETTASVTLHSDSRIHFLLEYKKKMNTNEGFNYTPIGNSGTSGSNTISSIRTAKGFRVLIYSGTDRAKANKIKADYMRRHQGHRVYMTYALPQYKIKVGDFATRQDAGDLYRQLSKEYMPCMVVPDIVELKTYRKND